LVIQGVGPPLGDHHQIPSGFDPLFVNTEEFAHLPFNPVPDNGVADLPSDRNPDPGPAQVIIPDQDQEMPGSEPFLGGPGGFEVFGSPPETFRPAKALTARRSSGPGSGSRGARFRMNDSRALAARMGPCIRNESVGRLAGLPSRRTARNGLQVHLHPPGFSVQTVSCLRPRARRRRITAAPERVRIRTRKPWVRFRFRLLG
jgi:hypothetical protein